MNMRKSESFRQRLIKLRQELRLSQRELALKFRVSPGAIALWESGRRTISGPISLLIELNEKHIAEVESKST